MQEFYPNVIAESFDSRGITQPNFRDCQRKITAFLEVRIMEIIVDDDETGDLKALMTMERKIGGASNDDNDTNEKEDGNEHKSDEIA